MTTGPIINGEHLRDKQLALKCFDFEPGAHIERPKQMLRGKNDFLCYENFLKPQQAVQRTAMTLEAASDFAAQWPPLNSTHIRIPPSNGPQSLPKHINSMYLRAGIPNIEEEETRRLYVLELDKLLIKLAQSALSNLFQAGCEEPNDGLNNVSFFTLQTVLTETACSSTLDDMFELRTEKWTKSFPFRDAFTSCPIIGQLVNAYKIRWCYDNIILFCMLRREFHSLIMKTELNKVGSVEREPEVLLSSPPTSLSGSESFVDVKIRKDAIDKHEKMPKLQDDDEERLRKNSTTSSFSSSLLNVRASTADPKLIP